MSKQTYIGECGHPVWDKTVKTCRKCWLSTQRKPPKLCKDCQKPLSRGVGGGVSKSKRCRSCQSEHQRKWVTCAGCNEQFPSSGKTKAWTRCRPCSDQWRRNRPKPLCIQCNQYPQRSKKLCRNCYKTKWYRERGLRRVPGRAGMYHQWIQGQPCCLCGYEETPVDAHRLNPTLGYQEGNVVPLYPNCHRKVTQGITALPDDIFAC